MLEPKVIIPIHTNSPEKFVAAFPSWNVKMLEDGEIFSTNPFGDIPVHEEGDTFLSAICLSEDQDSDDNVRISSVDERLKWWKLDYKNISSFDDSNLARETLKLVRADKNVLAFVAHYAPDMIVKPLVDIETFEGKVLCDLVPVRYLFPMDVVEQLHKKK